jgi:hypothetical protein
MTSNPTDTQARIDWKFIFLGAAVAIAVEAYAGTALYNIGARILLAQGATPQEVYSYFVSHSLTVAGLLTLVYNTAFGFVCGRVATMRTGQRSLAAGAISGLIALSFEGVMALGTTPDPRAPWQLAAGILLPLLASILGSARRSDA